MADEAKGTGGMDFFGPMSIVSAGIDTGLDMYKSWNGGRIAAIEADAKAKRFIHENQMSQIDTQTQIDQLGLQHTEKMAGIYDQFENIQESQEMGVSSQGRSMDSISSIKEADTRQVTQDVAMSKLNRDAGVNLLESQQKVKDVSTDWNAHMAKSQGKDAKSKSYYEMAGDLGEGLGEMMKLKTPSKKGEVKDDKKLKPFPMKFLGGGSSSSVG